MSRARKWVVLSSLFAPGMALPTPAPAPQVPPEQAMVTCYPKESPSGARVLVSKNGSSYRLSLLDPGAEPTELVGSGRNYGDGRLQIDVPAKGKQSPVGLSIGSQFVLDSTIGNYSYLVGVLTRSSKTEQLRCYYDEVHRWATEPLFYREVIKGDRNGLLQEAQGRLLSHGYRHLVSTTKSERTVGGTKPTTFYSVSAVYENSTNHTKRTLTVTGSRRGWLEASVDSAKIAESR